MRKKVFPWGQGLLYGLYQKRLRHELNDLSPNELPQHVAMIIDGNRRWAKLAGWTSAVHGHRAGAAKMREFLQWCDDLDIQVVTLYLLSADNLTHRENTELADLIDIIAELATWLATNPAWRVKHVGSTVGLPDQLVETLRRAEENTHDHSGLHINLAIGYGGRKEITDAMRSIVDAHSANGGSLETLADLLTPDLIGRHLYTGGQPDPDLVIRTSGEQRLSDFMLWQSAHSEFYFVEALGPDLREIDFLRAVRDYSRRHRRFGS